MSTNLLLDLTLVLLLGIFAQWLAWRLNLPSILLLLVAGLAVGPGLGLLDPDRLMGDLLFPFVKVAVAVILYEGGLTLRLDDLRQVRSVVRNLISVGVLITWVLAAAAAYFLLNLSLSISLLFGAVLTVTGPTVIGPLLRFIRPQGESGKALKWEGILVDPVGAMLAVLVFEHIQDGVTAGWTGTALALGKTILFGGFFGFAGAAVLYGMTRTRQIPEFLLNPISLSIVVGIATASNQFQHESGLLAATVMGVLVANQRRMRIGQILEFKETLRLLLISALFVLLAARVERAELAAFGVQDLLFVGALVFVVRPLAVAASTVGSSLNWRERLFLSWMAPRGIVAAAVASIFSLDLMHSGVPGAERLMPLTFLVIVATVVIYGLTAGPLARLLGLAEGRAQGFVFVGAHPIARRIAGELKRMGVRVLLVDSNRSNVLQAQVEGLEARRGNVLSENLVEQLDLAGIGRSIALTANDEVNTLATVRFAERFGADNVFQLVPSALQGNPDQRDMSRDELRGRALFERGCGFASLQRAFEAGGEISTLPVTEERAAIHDDEHPTELPLFVRRTDGRILPVTCDDPPTIRPGADLVVMRGEPVRALPLHQEPVELDQEESESG